MINNSTICIISKVCDTNWMIQNLKLKTYGINSQKRYFIHCIFSTSLPSLLLMASTLSVSTVKNSSYPAGTSLRGVEMHWRVSWPSSLFGNIIGVPVKGLCLKMLFRQTGRSAEHTISF